MNVEEIKPQIQRILSLKDLEIHEVTGISKKDDISSLFGDDEIFVHNNLLIIGYISNKYFITTYVVGTLDEILETFSSGEDVRFQEQPPETGTVRKYVEGFLSDILLGK